MDLQVLQERCESFIAGRLACDPAHDIQHIKRVVNNTLYLSELSSANTAITVPAAWLHDCVQVPKDSPERSQVSRLAADEGCRFLAECGYPIALLPAVHHAIEAHSYSAGIEVRSLEAGIVQDADRLDALGAIGIARCLLTGGALGSLVYHPEDPFCEQREPDDRAYMVDHFYAKLFKLPDTMQTEAGREEAQRRVRMMNGYLEELRKEVLEASATP
jgi:uncharacterized protein